ncbi:MAG: NUDIX domain-containing protein [Lentisphaerae bacterium]|nr:NUDIX domain-containing protein [Lentisphaerota bacterium]
MSSEVPEQHPVPVVRLVITNRDGNVLILRRAHATYGEGDWCLPGGKVDYGETVEQTIARELLEETSLEADSPRFLFYQDSLPIRPGGMHCVNLCFECSASGDVVLNEESSEYAWIGPADLDRYTIVFRNDEVLEQYWQAP